MSKESSERGLNKGNLKIIVNFCLKLPYIVSETINTCPWLQMVRMKLGLKIFKVINDSIQLKRKQMKSITTV